MKKFVYGGRTKIKLRETPGIDRGNVNGKSCVPLVKQKTVKAEGVGGWGYDPTWAGDKGSGLNSGEDRAIKALDRKRRDYRRNPPAKAPPVLGAKRETRVMLAHKLDRMLAKYR
jgi:hypothetical protein